MPDFPKINDKFYAVGQKCTTLRRAIETIGGIYEAADAAASKTPAEFPDHREVESKTFSVMVGFVDGTLARIAARR